jgi:hypothetical protein
MADIPLYFEMSWAILSSIGLINAIFGCMVVGITGLSLLSLVPIIVSIAAAIANGLCFYAFYSNYSSTATLLAAVFADLGWLVGLPSSRSFLRTSSLTYQNRSKKPDSPSTAT